MISESENIECCICMDVINCSTNNCVTPCGHKFCFQCLAKALEQNNTCPCCRAVLIENNEDPEDEDTEMWSEYSYQEYELYSDDSLTSFRIFTQRLDGEEIEEDPLENNESTIASDTTTEEDGDREQETIATVEDITAKLQSRGVTMLDLVAMLCGRKSKHLEKHSDRFMDALDIIIDSAVDDCDLEIMERFNRSMH